MSATTTGELVAIDERRLLRRLDDLAQRGALAQGGIYRALYTPAWSSAMELVASWLKEAGLFVRRDAVGNVWGRIEGSRGGRAIVTGSATPTASRSPTRCVRSASTPPLRRVPCVATSTSSSSCT